MKIHRWALALAVMIIAETGAFPALYAQKPGVPAYGEHGPYAVGARDLTILDDDRPLEMTIWYPAQVAAGAAPTITYQVGPMTLTGQAGRDAAPDSSGGPYPLVIFSHGSNSFRQHNHSLTEHLASHGFIVMAADHPGNTLFDTAETLLSIGNALVANFAQRPQDVLRQIAYAEALAVGDDPLAGLIDLERIAVAGYSFGGYTALAVGGARLDFEAFRAWCLRPRQTVFDPAGEPPLRTAHRDYTLTLTSCPVALRGDLIAHERGLDAVPDGLWPPTTDPRIRAVIALAPWNAPVFGPDGLAALTVPALVQVGAADRVAPPERDAYAIYAGIGSPRKALVAYRGARHGLFTDAAAGLPVDLAWDADEAHALVNHFATAFLLATLADDADAAAMLAPGAVDFAGVSYTATFE